MSEIQQHERTMKQQLSSSQFLPNVIHTNVERTKRSRTETTKLFNMPPTSQITIVGRRRRPIIKGNDYGAAIITAIVFVLTTTMTASSTITSEVSNNFLRTNGKQQKLTASSSSSTPESQSSSLSSPMSTCYYCHLLFPEVLTKSHEGSIRDNIPIIDTVQRRDDYNNEVHCLRRIKGSESMIKHPIAITLPQEFLYNHTSLIDNGEAHVCIHGAYETQIEEIAQSTDLHRRRNAIVQIPNGSDSIELLHRDHPVRVLQETNENTQVRSNTTSYFFGTKRLLVVRVVTAGYVEQPAETIDEIQGAIFGTGLNPDNIPIEGTVVAQYNAVSQGNLFFTPAAFVDSSDNNELQSSSSTGVMEVELPSYVDTFINASIRDYLVPEILKATETKLGQPLDQVADYIIFCIPNDSVLRDDSQWTAFTYLYEPVCFNYYYFCYRIRFFLFFLFWILHYVFLSLFVGLF
jgi:hypothetical protein